MNQIGSGKILTLAGIFFLAWGVIRYFLPLAAPFLLGWFLALLAEPAVGFLHSRLKLPRAAAAGIGVSLVLLALSGILLLVMALCYRELASLAAGIPGYADALSDRIILLRDWAAEAAARAPGSLGRFLPRLVSQLFAGGSVFLERLAGGALSAAGNVAGRLPGGALLLGTAVVSAYLISGQYPALRRRFLENAGIREKWIPLARNLWNTAGLWARAQLRLTAVTFGITALGLLILRVDHWLLWAFITALVDAIPMLGTGIVLIPMALVSLLWGETVRAIGLASLFLTAMLTRSALEPRLVGRHLGMNPLTTLIALYAGFRIWGVPGMILSPILAVTATQLLAHRG